MSEGTVSPTLSEWLVVFLIVFSLIFEAVLHRFEHWLNHRHQHLQSVVRGLYRELMLLGFVSFIFILYQFIKKPGKSTVLSFEFAHVFIFLLAAFYTLVVLSSMFTSLRLSARWKKMEQLDLVKYLHLKEEYARLRIRVHKHHGPMWRRFSWWFPNFVTLWHYRDLHEIMAFHDIRFQFIFYRNLPEHFRFSSFLRKIKSLTFAKLVESHWTIQAIFLIFVLFDILRRNLTDTDEKEIDNVESACVIASALLLAIIVQVLAIKIRKVYWELTKHPRVYYQDVQADAVMEELAAVENRLEADMAKRRKSRSGDLSDDPGTIADDEATDAGNARDYSPDKELAVPMSPEPLSKTLVLAGSPDPEKASALVPNPSLQATMSEARLSLPILDANESRRSENYSGRGAITAGSRHSWGARTSLPENKHVYQSRSHFRDYGRGTEYPMANRTDATTIQYSENKSSRSSISERPSSKPIPSEKAVPMQFEEIAARHSLEITRHSVTTPKRVLDPSSQASVAMAAVAAARKRGIEKQVERNSIENGNDPERRSIGTPHIRSQLSSRGVSTEDDARVSGSDFVHASLDGRGKRRGRSIELVAAMPHQEMVERHNHQHSFNEDLDLEAGAVRRADNADIANGEQPSSPKGKLGFFRYASSRQEATTGQNAGESNDGGALSGMNSFIRHRSLGFMNATILKNLEHQQKAQTMEPAQYPWIVKKLIPRLGRVASPVEKLFWFGSHKFFLWCVGFTLYFSTMFTAAATAGLSLRLLSSENKPITQLNIVSYVLPPITLLFVLFRIAGIIKKYIFILHNASLVPEALAIEAIHKVSTKQKTIVRDDLSDVSGSETEREDEDAARERRRNLGRFFRSEAEVGNIPGIEPAANRTSNDGSEAVASRRAVKRKVARRLRRRRARVTESRIPQVPTDPREAVLSD